jgi:hypothetical protein
MKTLGLFLCAAIIGLPLIVDAAAPSVKITTPTKSPTTSGTLNAAGTAKSAIPIAAVFYSFNGGAWTLATGTTAWSTPGLVLTAGANTFSAYAVDTNSVASKTNTVVFTYVVMAPISLLINGSGTVTPIQNGALLEIGNTYKLSAKAAKGFGFAGWSGGVNSDSSKLSFVMASNLVITANFADITRPLCVVTFPSVKQSVSNSPIVITGRASDNVGVAGVAYQLNGGGWELATIIDGTNWTTPGVALTPGANSIQAFAQDAAGNLSLTNTVTFTYTSNAPPPPVGPAPASIAGTTAQISLNGGVFEVSFGDNTFSQDGEGGGNSSFAGDYTYTLLSSNMAQLTFSTVVPPQNSGSGDQVTLTFTDNTDATFTDTNGDSGALTLAAAPSLAPNPSTAFTVQWIDMGGATNTLTFAGGVFTNVDSDGNVNSGNYVLESFSPLGVMLSLFVHNGPLAGSDLYVQLDFFNANAGDLSVSVFDNASNLLESDVEPFTVLNASGAPAGNAPLSLAGTDWSVSISGKTGFQIAFGTATYSESSSGSQNNNNAGNYIYMKTGPNTAVFKNIQTLPPSDPGNSSDPENFLVYLTFSKPTVASVLSTNVDSGQTNIQTGSISAKPAPNTALDSIAGRTLKASGGGHTDTLIFGTDGTFTHSGSNGINNSGVYTYSRFSPNGAMAVINITSGSDNGNTSYGQLTFTSSGGGTIFVTSFDPFGNLQDSHSGTFTLQ